MGEELIRRTIPEQIRIKAQDCPQQCAYIFPDENMRLTFKEIEIYAGKISRALLGMGLKKGDHIGIWAYNCSKWLGLLLGAAQIGVVVVPLNTCYQYEELDDLCVRGDLDVLFVNCTYRGHSLKSVTDAFFDNGKIKKKYLRLKSIVAFDCEENPYKSWQWFLESGQCISDEKLQAAMNQVELNDDYLIQYTSGTTSRPKGAVLYQQGVMHTASGYVQKLHLNEKDITCVPLPLFHCFGNVLTLLGGLISGSTTIYLSYFSPKLMLKLIEKEKCTCMMGVPTMYFAMLSMPDFKKYNLTTLKKAGVGGALCPVELCRRISSAFQIPGLIIGYGLSEAASLCILSDIEDKEGIRLHTAGRPLPGLEVVLADKRGKADATNVKGEILVRGMGVMKGYYKDEKHTREALDRDGWLHTGDIGKKNEDGTFCIVGRVKDIIIKGGENISPSDIEEKLLMLENVRECQCVGVPDEKYGEEVCACLVSDDGEDISQEIVINYLRSKIAPYKLPRYVLMFDHFPINGSGKVIKNKLSEIARKRLVMK